MTTFFSDREQGPRARTEESLTPAAWGGIVSIIQSLASTGAFGFKYPELCPDGEAPIGTDQTALTLAIQAEIPRLEWPLSTSIKIENDYFTERQPFAPPAILALDLIEFCYRIVAKPIQGSHHKFFDHHHLSFNEIEGKQVFLDDINRVLARNGLAYELAVNGQIVRLAPAVLRESLITAHFCSGDNKLDQMLENARIKFLNPKTSIRHEALHGLWDCWERLKSLERPNENKKISIEALLSKASNCEEFKTMLNVEARALTDIGNNFGIRHSEVKQSSINDSAHIDYLFHRMFCCIQLLLLKRSEAK